LTGDKCSIYINALVTLFVIMDTAVKISRRWNRKNALG
jgi:hypothetical protein